MTLFTYWGWFWASFLRSQIVLMYSIVIMAHFPDGDLCKHSLHNRSCRVPLAAMQLSHVLCSHSAFWRAPSSQCQCQEGCIYIQGHYQTLLSTPQLTAQGWRWGSVGAPALQHSPPQSHHCYCAWILLFFQVLTMSQDRQICCITAPSHYCLSLKSTGLSGWFLAGPTLFEELKPCSGTEPIVSRDRKVLGSSRT